jgi:Mn-dependent DtxR family transcriptional regulator
MNRAAGDSHPNFTPRQGQYLAFIHAYTLVNGRSPAQADIQRFFQVTPPSVHQMLLTLERGGLISRRPGAGVRSHLINFTTKALWRKRRGLRLAGADLTCRRPRHGTRC